MGQFVKVAKLSDIPPGNLIGVDVGDLRIAIGNVDGTLFAVQSECPHMGGPLEEGFLEGTSLQCPWHAGDFNITNGEAINPPATGTLSCYKLRLQGDDVEMETP